MRWTFFLLTASLMTVHAAGLSQTVSLSGRNLSLRQVFSAIERQTGYVVFSNRRILDEARPVSLNVQNMPLVTLLDVTLKDQPLQYIIEGKTIVLSHKTSTPREQTDTALREEEITGRITTMEGEPIPRATITIRSLKKAVLADDNGQFSIPQAGMPLMAEVSAIGFAPLTFRIADGKTVLVKAAGQPQGGAIVTGADGVITILMARSVSPLDEVQVIAYGQSTRRTGLGNVTTIKAEEIEKQPVNNVLLALQGRVPGMQISTRTGNMPGATPEIRIRGINSIAAGKSPLFILNGIPVPETQSAVNSSIMFDFSTLLNINPADVESIDVLKDAEATAIYGSRGANGVILITTKKGKAGRTSVNVNAYTGFGHVARRLPFLDVHQYNAMRREAFANDGRVPTAGTAADLFTWDTTSVHDWQDEMIGGTAVTHDVNLSVSGGNAHTTFLVSGNYHKDGTTYPGDFGADRKSLRLTLDHRSPNGKIGIGGSAAMVNTHIGLLSYNLISFITLAPAYPLQHEDGTPNFDSGNPYAYKLQPFDNDVNTFNGSLSFRYTPVKNLDLKLNVGLDNAQGDQLQKSPSYAQAPGNQASMAMRKSVARTWIAEPQLNYTVHAGKHAVKVLIGGTWQQTTYDDFGATGMGFSNDALLGNISSAATVYPYNTSREYAYNSFFSRLSYDWNREYLLNLSFRRDGSSRFGPGRRFGNFGAVSAGWVFSQNETVSKALPFLSFGKLRASYGLNGNDQIGDYGYITTYSPGIQYQGATLAPSNLANPDYRWEENRKLEVSLETGFMEDRFLFSAAWFRNRTNNQLIDFIISPQAGYGSYSANFPALLQNTGWEFMASSRNIVAKNFSWKTSLNFSLSRNKLLEFPNIEQTGYSSQYFVGYPLSVMQAYRFQGLSNTGVPILEDRNKDNRISSDDRYIVGSNNPLFGGMSNDFSYKRVTLGFFLEYSRFMGFDNTISASRVGTTTNVMTQVLDRWQKPGDEAFTTRPKFTTSSATYNARFYSQSDLFWQTYHIFRLRNVNVAYDMPAEYLRRAGIQKMQLYMHAQNLWVADRNPYRYDPESGNQHMPPLRTFTFGINCTF